MDIIKTENLTHVYSPGTPFERTGVQGVDLSVADGEILGIIGHSGSGKSTFIQHLNGLLKPTTGHVYFDGRDIHESKEYTRKTRFNVGIVFQYPEYQLFEATLYADIAFGPKNMGLGEDEIRERVHEAIALTGLDESLLQKSPFELSGGQKRRAAIAGVIAMRPKVLVLDEPTAGLDPRGRDEIIGNIMNFKHAHDATIIMVTHNMEEIAKTVQRIVIFDNGKITIDGTLSEVFADGDKLLSMGLSAPKAAMVAARLRNMGLPIGCDIHTVAQLRAAINGLRGDGHA